MLIRCILQLGAWPLLTECAPVALVLERTRVVVGGKKKNCMFRSLTTKCLPFLLALVGLQHEKLSIIALPLEVYRKGLS